MFTGLIERVGKILRIQALRKGKKFLIDAGAAFEVSEGDSVALDGACFTVTEKDVDSFWVEVSPESLGRTTFGKKKAGDRVNMERSLKLGDRLGGHMVLGHIDGIGKVKKISNRGEFQEMEIETRRGLEKYLVEKGSIAVDGVSLTVNQVSDLVFSVMLIPETLKRTTLGGKRAGDEVNLEFDILGKYVERLLRNEKKALSLERLQEEGF
jgi:riboflavin synthase